MKKSESTKEITKALLEFHKKVKKINKESENPFFKNMYASLPNILDAISEPLNECGLIILQFPEVDFELTTLLQHESGEFFESVIKMQPQQNNPQGIGSLITYQRRYAIGAILNLNIDEDDDGNNASGNKANNQKKENKQQPQQQPQQQNQQQINNRQYGKNCSLASFSPRPVHS